MDRLLLEFHCNGILLKEEVRAQMRLECIQYGRCLTDFEVVKKLFEELAVNSLKLKAEKLRYYDSP